jgi:hypothetical protein
MMLITDSFGRCDWAYFRTRAEQLLMAILVRETSLRLLILPACEKEEEKEGLAPRLNALSPVSNKTTVIVRPDGIKTR